MGQAGRQVLQLVARLRDELHVNTTCGASNLSFGLPNRQALNAAFVSMAIGAGLSSAILNPLHPEMMRTIRAADIVIGADPGCAAWISAYRQLPDEATPRRRQRRRHRGRAGAI